MKNKRLTSQGGGALLYDGTILNVTEPLASLWKFNEKNKVSMLFSFVMYRNT